MKYPFYLVILLIHFFIDSKGQKTYDHLDYDVVIAGATPAAIAAAVTAARHGAKVVIIERTNHLGGAVTGGCSNTDFITYESIGGIWKEFMDRIVEHYKETYGPNSSQLQYSMNGALFEPKVSMMVFKNMLAEHNDKIDILLQHSLEYVETQLIPNNYSEIKAIRVKDVQSSKIKIIKGKVFIDATYMGDLMAKAGCDYRIGSEPKSEYNESLASEEANWHVQCYNFKPVLSNDPENKLPIPKPEKYKRELYAPLVDLIKAGKFDDLSEIINDDRPIPNNKASFNDEKGAPISMHVCNPTDVWPEGNHHTRQLVFDYIKDHNLGFLYFLQHDPELPAWVKEEMGQWGLPKDEFEETGHWPPVVYVREGRRMLGEYIFTQHDTQPVEGSVRAPANENAIADYVINSHGTHEPAPGVLKGELQGKTRPWQVPYGVMLPDNVDGLLVPVAVSASRVGYGAVRMEPTWTALGEAAGLAAVQAIEKNENLREISIPDLQIQLHDSGAKTFYASDVPASSPYFKAVQFLGNRGFFQHLYDPEEATDWSREIIKGPGPPNHFTTAFPYHDIKPQKIMTKELAGKWLKMAKMTDSSLITSYHELTRGEFLNKIYDHFLNDK